MRMRFVIAVLLWQHAITAHSFAWNALGHKVVAEIAWLEIESPTRQRIVHILRRHPRFDADFAGKMTDDVLSADKNVQDHWIFQHAATWPDIIRGNREYDQPLWHYVDFPLYLDGSDREAISPRFALNLSEEYPTRIEPSEYNVIQAVKHCQATLLSRAGPDAKAMAYCWLFHLVGDLHQPLHSTALFSVKQFPKGDKGGNDIILRRGRNLHALWDGLLGRRYFMRDVDREIKELSDRSRYGDVWNSAKQETDVSKWVAESHELCKTIVYSDRILDAVRNTPPGAELAPIELPDAYMREAGDVARRRIIAAGLRLRSILENSRPH